MTRSLQVRSLGRGGGKGPLRRAPEEVYAVKRPPGVIRSPLVPEEVRGLHRSGNLTQMLPAEAALMAVGWPRRPAAEADSRGGDGGGATVEEGLGESEAEEERGSHPARLLFMARLAEKGLMSYERAGAAVAAVCPPTCWCLPMRSGSIRFCDRATYERSYALAAVPYEAAVFSCPETCPTHVYIAVAETPLASSPLSLSHARFRCRVAGRRAGAGDGADGDAARGGARADHRVPRHERLDVRRAGGGGQGRGARVHAWRAPAGPQVLRLRLQVRPRQPL